MWSVVRSSDGASAGTFESPRLAGVVARANRASGSAGAPRRSARLVLVIEDQLPELDPQQTAMGTSIEEVASEFGKFGQGPWEADYVGPEQNRLLPEGICCGSCVWFDGEAGCEIVDGAVEDDGVCRLRVVPGPLEPATYRSVEDMVEAEASARLDRIENTVIRLAARYFDER